MMRSSHNRIVLEQIPNTFLDSDSQGFDFGAIITILLKIIKKETLTSGQKKRQCPMEA